MSRVQRLSHTEQLSAERVTSPSYSDLDARLKAAEAERQKLRVENCRLLDRMKEVEANARRMQAALESTYSGFQATCNYCDYVSPVERVKTEARVHVIKHTEGCELNPTKQLEKKIQEMEKRVEDLISVLNTTIKRLCQG